MSPPWDAGRDLGNAASMNQCSKESELLQKRTSGYED